MADSGPGRVIYVVGPSGSGKDTLLDAARQALGDQPKLCFVRREITRPADTGLERHIAVPRESFLKREIDGHYALSWHANGLGYGITRSSLEWLSSDEVAVISGSRAVIDRARESFPGCWVVQITAPTTMLRARLRGRGRETAAEIDARLERAESIEISGSDIVEIINDGDVADGVQQLTVLLQAALESLPIPADRTIGC